MPTPRSSTASLQHSLDPQTVWSTSASCPPEPERSELSSPRAETSADPQFNDGALRGPASPLAPGQQQQQPTPTSSSNPPQTLSAQPQAVAMDLDSELTSGLSDISTISGLSPIQTDTQSDKSGSTGTMVGSNGSSTQDGLEHQRAPISGYFDGDTITSDGFLSNARVSEISKSLTAMAPNASNSFSPRTLPLSCDPGVSSLVPSSRIARTTRLRLR